MTHETTPEPLAGPVPAATPDLQSYRDRLVRECRDRDGITSLVFYGSAARSEAGRRDEWSDLDFNVFFTPQAEADLRARWPFLPDPERLVLTAREGRDGGVALYDDGMLLEFGAGLPWEIGDPVREVALDGGDLRLVDPPSRPDAADQIRLFLVKLYIGMGRHRRGERLAAGSHIRTYALSSLCWSLRLRLAPQEPANPFDPLRRFEVALPDHAAALARLLEDDLETCARGLLALARRDLEPGWADFPGTAADTVQQRLGWRG